jgi:hypothetical protein
MMKKLTAFLLVLMFVITASSVVYGRTEVSVSAHSVIVDGNRADIRAFNIGGRNYFMLRDIAYALRDTHARFDVDWSEAQGAVTLTAGIAYNEPPLVTEASNATARQSTAVVYVNGGRVDFTVYNIGGRNYFMLRELGDALDFTVDWDSDAGAVLIDTGTAFAGTVSSFTGAGDRGFVNGNSAAARFLMPQSAVARGSDLIVFDTFNNAIRRVATNGAVTTLAGERNDLDEHRLPLGGHRDGELSQALFNRPSSGVVNSSGELIIADSANNVLRVICADLRTVRTLDIELNRPMALAVDTDDNIFVADTLNDRILRISSDGDVQIIAGDLNAPAGIAVCENGIIYVSDTGNHRIIKIENGFVTTLAGMVTEFDSDGDPFGGFANGHVSEARFNSPMGITLADDMIIVADSANHVIRAIYNDTVTTFAGAGIPGDAYGDVRSAEFNTPAGVYYYEHVLYIIDTVNNKIKTVIL